MSGRHSCFVKEAELLPEMITGSGDRIGVVLEKEAKCFFLWRTQC